MIDNLNSVKWLPVLMGALGLMLLLSLLTAYMGNRAAGDRQTRMLNASLLNERLDVVGAAATRAGGGDDAGYQQLAELKEQVASVKGRLAGAGIEAGTSSDWQAFDAAIERLLIVQEQVQRLQADVDQAIAEAGVFVTAMQRMSATLLGSRWQSQREGLERAAGTSNSIIQTMEAYNDGQLRIVDFRPQIDAAAAELADEVEGLLADEQFGGQAADEVRLAYQNFEPVLRVAAEAIAARVETNSSLIDLAAATDRLRGQVNAAVSAAGHGEVIVVPDSRYIDPAFFRISGNEPWFARLSAPKHALWGSHVEFTFQFVPISMTVETTRFKKRVDLESKQFFRIYVLSRLRLLFLTASSQ